MLKLNPLFPIVIMINRTKIHYLGTIPILFAVFMSLLISGCEPGHSLDSGDIEEILPGLRIWKGSVNTVALERNEKTLLIDPGNFAAAPGGGPVDLVLVTHHHRDQATRLSELANNGAQVIVPKKEESLFSNAEAFWQSWDPYRFSTYRPHTFTQLSSSSVTKSVQDGDQIEWEGLTIGVIETPGHTDGSVTYLLDLDGKRIAFTGDLIYGPGKIWEMYSLQKKFPGMGATHLGFGGSSNELKASLDRVLGENPDILVPSHGVVMNDPKGAIAELKENLDAVMGNYLIATAWRVFDRHKKAFEMSFPAGSHPMLPSLPPVSYPPWIRDIEWTTQAIVGDDGSLFLSDCGYPVVPEKLLEMRKAGEFKKVDVIWLTHYHLDHNMETNYVRKRFGAKVYVQEEMADITENPRAYPMSAQHPESIEIDRVMKHGETIEWKGVKLTFFHFPGQTEYHGGLLAEKDGFKAFFTGDSIQNWGIEDYCSYFRCFVSENRGYEKCLQILIDTEPDILVRAHTGPMGFSVEHARKTLKLVQEREKLYRKLFPYDDPNFALDPYWIRAYPYRQTILPGGVCEVAARVMNHSSSSKNAEAELHLPEGWKSIQVSGSTTIPPRSEGSIRFQAVAPDNLGYKRWHILSVSVTFYGTRYEQFAEAVVELYQPK